MNHLGNATILLLLGIAVSACGGAKRAAEAPADAGGAEGGDAAAEPDGASDAAGDAAESSGDPVAAFDKAEKELGDLLKGDKNGTKVPAAQPGSTPTLSGDDDDDGEEIAQLDRQNRCVTACKALASMKRSADRVCSMTGEEDSRCESLRARVDRAKSLVYASCPSCAAARP